MFFFFFSSRRRHTRLVSDWSSDVCSSDLPGYNAPSPYAAPRYVEPRREPGYGSEMRERCVGLHREAQMLRHRLDREWNPMERARTEGRLREVRERADRCR